MVYGSFSLHCYFLLENDIAHNALLPSIVILNCDEPQEFVTINISMTTRCCFLKQNLKRYPCLLKQVPVWRAKEN